MDITLKGIGLKFETAPTNFSPNKVDSGTLAMLSVTEFSKKDKILDLGCGYGVVGILAAALAGRENVILCDISECAVRQAKINAELNHLSGLDIRLSDGFSHVPEEDFTLILSNPPYHADFSTARRFIEGAFKKLAVGGRIIMVTKRREWYKNKLISTFGGVRIQEINGYYVFIAEKRSGMVRKKEKKAPALSRKLQRRQRE